MSDKKLSLEYLFSPQARKEMPYKDFMAAHEALGKKLTETAEYIENLDKHVGPMPVDKRSETQF